MSIQPLQGRPLSFTASKASHSPSWKEALFISSVALSAIASFAQMLVGSFTVSVFYGFLAYVSYAGYEMTKKLQRVKSQEEYYATLQENAEELKEECLSLRQETTAFRLENTAMAQNNQNLKTQIESLENKLKSMKDLLVTIDGSASLTKELLLSCMEVSSDQKKTEKKIQGIVEKLEKTCLATQQKEIEKQVKQLGNTLISMEKHIQQFFLHDTKGSELLKIKEEFSRTSKDLEEVKKELERVQRELSLTSSRLDKTSRGIDEKIQKSTLQESKLSLMEKLTPIVLKFLEKPEIHSHLSVKEQEMASILQKNWSTSFSS
jgi:predicted  nucleic acid-binding Zn-ribbon protein